MNIINLITKELKQNFRNFKAMTMMILFPIVLILVLGTALSGVFDSTAAFKDVKVLYLNESKGQIAQAFENYFIKAVEDKGAVFSSTDNIQEGLESVKDAKYSCFIKINKDDDAIELYKNERYAFKANLIESALSVFVQQINARMEIAKSRPEMIGELSKTGSSDYVKTVSAGENKQPNSMDYYAITMLTLIIMYASQTGAWAIKGERLAKTENRLVCSPVKRYEIMLGKLFGVFFTTLVQVLIVIMFSMFILKTYWGSHIGTVLLLVVAEIIMAISLGIGLAYVIKNEMAVNGVLNIIIPVTIFLGGGYFPIDAFSSVLLKLSGISPLRWINKALFQVIFSNDFSSVMIAVVINLSIAFALIILSSVLIRKEAVR